MNFKEKIQGFNIEKDASVTFYREDDEETYICKTKVGSEAIEIYGKEEMKRIDVIEVYQGQIISMDVLI